MSPIKRHFALFFQLLKKLDWVCLSFHFFPAFGALHMAECKHFSNVNPQTQSLWIINLIIGITGVELDSEKREMYSQV